MRRLWAFNAYVLREDDGSLTLIDTLFWSAGAILRACRPLGRIERIVVTHAHRDHVGSLEALAHRLPGIDVFAGAREQQILTGGFERLPGEPEGSGARLARVACKVMVARKRIGSLEVVPAPGHTPGQIALLDVRDRTLFAGDAFTAIRGQIQTTGHVRGPLSLAAKSSWHRPTANASAAALAALKPARLAAGHGRVVSEPTAAMQSAVKFAHD